MATFQNWSADVQSQPTQFLYPENEAEIVAIVKQAAQNQQQIRIVGAAHSFMPLCHTNQILLCLDKVAGIVEVDKSKVQATIWGGTRIRDLGKLLFEDGMALANQGDVDAQSIAGALSTGTHGSGTSFGSLSTMIVQLRMVSANGDILTCSETENADIFKAAQVSMGMLGIITQVTLQLVPIYKLHCNATKTTVADCLARLPELKKNRNFEFFYFPYTDVTQLKVMNPTEDAPQAYSVGNYLNDMILENGAFQLMSSLSKHIAPLTIPIAKLTGAAASSVSRKAWSHEVYPTPRLVRFHEMEYNIPAEHFTVAFTEIKNSIDKHQFRVHFPVECRFVKEDDIWLSPAYKRESAYIAVHQYQGMEYKAYFAEVEKICQKYGGRPHWGKLNTTNKSYLAEIYPKFADFIVIRRQLDPKGLFLNGYLKEIFE